jgi:hypothetical protein
MFEPYGSGSFGHQFAANPAHKRTQVPAWNSFGQAVLLRNQCLGQRASHVAARIDCSLMIPQPMPP